MRKIDGRKAEVIKPGSFYTTYRSFAEKFGYPDAAVERDSIPSMRTPRKGSIVTLLTCGRHLTDALRILWIVETEKNERFIISEEGLRILDKEVTGVTVLKDESLSVAGRVIEREYREVKRMANVGERIKIVNAQYELSGKTWGYDNGEVHTVTTSEESREAYIRPDGTMDSEIYVEEDEYVTLEPSDIIRINTPDGDGEAARFRMVDRKAAVGERVITTGGSCACYETGDLAKVLSSSERVAFVDLTENADYYDDGKWYIDRNDYCVLEPVDAPTPEPLSAKPAHDQAAEIIAKLTMSVSTLASQVQSLAVQLRVVREDCVLIEEGVSDDVRDLDKRLAALEAAEVTDEDVAEISRIASEIQARAKSPQEIRDDIVKRAKEDVADLLDIGELQERTLPANNPLYDDFYRVEFVVNTEKRTVVALLRPKYGDLFHLETGTFRVFKGIAKCAPGDVFNVWIGRAIALRRALGLAVPAEYFEAPNPTEVRVGDYVYNSAKTKRMLIVTSENLRFGQFLTKGYAEELKLDVIDDSREDSAEPRKEVA